MQRSAPAAAVPSPATAHPVQRTQKPGAAPLHSTPNSPQPSPGRPETNRALRLARHASHQPPPHDVYDGSAAPPPYSRYGVMTQSPPLPTSLATAATAHLAPPRSGRI